MVGRVQADYEAYPEIDGVFRLVMMEQKISAIYSDGDAKQVN
jgi:hypothetical protein